MSGPLVLPLTPIASAPEADSFLECPLAFSPTEPIVAYFRKRPAQNAKEEHGQLLALYDYVARRDIARLRIEERAPIVRFSPSGRSLLVSSGRDMFVFTRPWATTSARQITAGYWHTDVCFLDEETLLMAGTTKHDAASVAVHNIATRALDVLWEGDRPEGLNDSVDDGACSPAGTVAFSIGYGRRLLVLRVNPERSSVAVEVDGPSRYNGNGYTVSLPDDGDAILLVAKYGKGNAVLYGRDGKELARLPAASCSAIRGEAIALGSRHEVQLFRRRAASVDPWCRWSGYQVDGVALRADAERIVLAVAESSRPLAVSAVADFDLLQLNADDPVQRLAAIRQVGDRRLAAARRPLALMLRGREADVRVAAARALAAIADPAALPDIVRAVGDALAKDAAPQLAPPLLGAIMAFPPQMRESALRDALASPVLALRRGAALTLAADSGVDAVAPLADALWDADALVRFHAAQGLGVRRDAGAICALLGRLDDPNDMVRLAAHQALVASLRAAGALPPAFVAATIAVDVLGYTRHLLAHGRPPTDNDPARELFDALAEALVRSVQPVALLRETMERIIAGGLSASDGPALGIAFGFNCARAMARAGQHAKAALLFDAAAAGCARSGAPNLEWRCWDGAGQARDALGDHEGALASYRRAMSKIDELWYALLEEGTLRGFFRDKAQLYERAGVCCLRLGHEGLALECLERAKTRYLGDLISRRHHAPRAVLAREIEELWAQLDRAMPQRVPVASGAAARSATPQILGMRWVSDDDDGAGASGGADNTPAMEPEGLARLRSAAQVEPDLERFVNMVQNLWESLAVPAAQDPEARPALETLHDLLLQAVFTEESSGLPLSPAEAHEWSKQFGDAAQELLQFGTDPPHRGLIAAGGDDDRPSRPQRMWAFNEYSGWFQSLIQPGAPPSGGLVLAAALEPLRLVLRRSPVVAVPREIDGEEAERSQQRRLGDRLVFEMSTGIDGGAARAAGQGLTTVVESALGRVERTRFRPAIRIARGKIAGLPAIAAGLGSDDATAQLHFAVTDAGTIVYVLQPRRQVEANHGLPGGPRIRVFLAPSLTADRLAALLTDGEGSWAGAYQRRRAGGGQRRWQATMEHVLGALHAPLFADVDEHLRREGVRRLWIVPHRSLHLIPFSALYGGAAVDSRQYLGDRYEIACAPSATLQDIPRSRASERSLEGGAWIGIGNPTQDLLHAEEEVQAIARLIPGEVRRVLPREEAEAARLAALPSPAILHFACHASYRWDDPLESSLHLAGGTRLTLGNLFDDGMLDLKRTGLVVLSACETGMTDPRDVADEYLGLASGFLFAGVPCVLSSLWAVDDLATRVLVQRFYRALLDPEAHRGAAPVWRAAAALRQAQLWVRRAREKDLADEIGTAAVAELLGRGRDVVAADAEAPAEVPSDHPLAHPYFWAGFTVTGG